MTDPYNSYAAYVPKVRQAPTAPKPDPISGLNVSEAWKARFRLIERAGGLKLSKLKQLSASERRSLNFNTLAFLLGPIYYLAKGLWRQALVYLGAAIGIVFGMTAMGWDTASPGLGIGFGMVYAMRANLSYYQLCVLGKAPWA